MDGDRADDPREDLMAWTSPLYRTYEHRLQKRLPIEKLPNHVGVILDGHRRFARSEGHDDYTPSYRIGMAKLEEFLRWCAQLHIPAVTAWVLSTDNLQRPPEELDSYLSVLLELVEDLPVSRNDSGSPPASSGVSTCCHHLSRRQPKRWKRIHQRGPGTSIWRLATAVDKRSSTVSCADLEPHRERDSARRIGSAHRHGEPLRPPLHG